VATLKSDDSALLKKLDLLPRELRSAFAAACAQRLLPHYRDFAVRTSGGLVKTRTTNDSGRLEHILTNFWGTLEGGADSTVLQKWRDMCESLLPNDYELGMDGAAQAEDAVAATLYATRPRYPGIARRLYGRPGGHARPSTTTFQIVWTMRATTSPLSIVKSSPVR
jgi:hypothetical protein